MNNKSKSSTSNQQWKSVSHTKANMKLKKWDKIQKNVVKEDPNRGH